MKNKLLNLIIIASLSISLVACGNNDNSDVSSQATRPGATEPNADQTDKPAKEDASKADKEEGGKADKGQAGKPATEDTNKDDKENKYPVFDLSKIIGKSLDEIVEILGEPKTKKNNSLIYELEDGSSLIIIEGALQVLTPCQWDVTRAPLEIPEGKPENLFKMYGLTDSPALIENMQLLEGSMISKDEEKYKITKFHAASVVDGTYSYFDIHWD